MLGTMDTDRTSSARRAPSGSSRQRGISPLLRSVGAGAGRTDHLRVSNAERQAVADRLAEHFSDGRLSQDEFDERAKQAVHATTRGDLRGLFDDLPEPGMPGVTLPGEEGGADLDRRDGWWYGAGWRAAAFALVIVICLAAAEAAVHATVPWLWALFVAIALLILTIRSARPGTGRHS